MFTKQQQEAMKELAADNEQADKEAAVERRLGLIRRARELHEAAEQAKVPAVLVAALLVADAIEAATKKLK